MRSNPEKLQIIFSIYNNITVSESLPLNFSIINGIHHRQISSIHPNIVLNDTNRSQIHLSVQLLFINIPKIIRKTKITYILNIHACIVYNKSSEQEKNYSMLSTNFKSEQINKSN